MEKYYNHGSMRFLVTILFAVMCSAVSAQRFETHKVTLSDIGGISKTVKIKGASTFSIKKDGRMTWAKYEAIDKAIKISATTNTTKNNRSCSFILLDSEGNPSDTLEVVQIGKISSVNSVTKAVGTSTKSSKSSSGGQCAARTKKGTRCSRKAAAGSIYCWQHNK
jgi:hypothetical protein